MSARKKPASADLGTLPSLEWIELDRLSIDARYQRAMGEKNERHVDRIVAGFNWCFYQPIVVTEQGDGFAVIDGQHRLEAARRHPKIDSLPCYVVDAPDVAAQAGIFIAANTQRIGLGRIHTFWAAHAAGAEWALRIHRLCTKAGVEINRTARTNLPPLTTVATHTIEKLLPLGDEAIGAALWVMASAQGSARDVFRSSTIAGLTRIFASHAGVLDVKTAVRLLAGLDLEDELRLAKADRAIGGGTLEAAMEARLRSRLGFVGRKAA